MLEFILGPQECSTRTIDEQVPILVTCDACLVAVRDQKRNVIRNVKNEYRGKWQSLVCRIHQCHNIKPHGKRHHATRLHTTRSDKDGTHIVYIGACVQEGLCNSRVIPPASSDQRSLAMLIRQFNVCTLSHPKSKRKTMAKFFRHINATNRARYAVLMRIHS